MDEATVSQHTETEDVTTLVEVDTIEKPKKKRQPTKKQLESLVELGCLHTISDDADTSVVSSLAKSVHCLLSDYHRRSNRSNLSQQLFDGQGALRVANLLKSTIREY